VVSAAKNGVRVTPFFLDALAGDPLDYLAKQHVEIFRFRRLDERRTFAGTT